MKSNRGANLLLLHFIILIWGFTGILGHEISLDAFSLVWWRVGIATLSIGLFALVTRRQFRAKGKDILKFAGVGILTAAHWICFFGSIKAANISVALVVISTTAFFVSIISPLVRKEKFYAYEILLGLVVIAGLMLIFKFENEYVKGIILSLFAALFAAVFSSFNSKLVSEHPATKIAFWEMLFAFLGITVFLFFKGSLTPSLVQIEFRDFYLLLLLGVVCTGFAFIVGINVMRVLSPFTCALAINMEPIYTIIIALAMYGKSEYMSPQFYLGAIIIMSTLFLDAWLKKRHTTKLNKLEQIKGP